jgi:RNA polymerase subunit RPABC4/transcription elongation factor Spt4
VGPRERRRVGRSPHRRRVEVAEVLACLGIKAACHDCRVFIAVLLRNCGSEDLEGWHAEFFLIDSSASQVAAKTWIQASRPVSSLPKKDLIGVGDCHMVTLVTAHPIQKTVHASSISDGRYVAETAM